MLIEMIMVVCLSMNLSEYWCNYIYIYWYDFTSYIHLSYYKPNKDHQQCLLYLVVNFGITDLALVLGTNGLEEQYNFTNIATTMLVKCMENWFMIAFVIFICHVFWLYSLCANELFVWWVCLMFYYLKAWFLTCSGTNWWFLIWSSVPPFTNLV